MSTQASKIVDLAKSQIGVKEYPANSNNVLYNTEYYGKAVSGSGYPWCCAFVWWVFNHAGLGSLFYGGGKTASCTALMNYYKSKGQTGNTPKVGAIVFYQFDKDVYADHVGIVESVGNGTITAIEGNTGVGNDANGGAVMRRTRKTSLVYCYAYPYTDTANATTTTAAGGKTVMVNLPMLRNGSKSAAVRTMQQLLKLKGYDPQGADGEFGAMTESALRRFQSANKLDVDGICGAQSWATLITK